MRPVDISEYIIHLVNFSSHWVPHIWRMSVLFERNLSFAGEDRISDPEIEAKSLGYHKEPTKKRKKQNLLAVAHIR